MGHTLRRKVPAVPSILLIGAGRFGKAYLRTLAELDQEGKIKFLGVVERNAALHGSLSREYGVRCFRTATADLLRECDAAFIVTPPETHSRLAKRCLRYTNVLVEKPLACTEKESLELARIAGRFGRTLSVAHILRFHPVTQALRRIIGKKPMPRRIEGEFLNPAEADQGREPSLEFLHIDDVVDYLWGKKPELAYGRSEGRITVMDVRYAPYHDARYTVGCRGDERSRKLALRYDGLRIEADFMEGRIRVTKGSDTSILTYPLPDNLLRVEILRFIDTLRGGKNTLSAVMGARVVSIGERAIPKRKISPRVAVIGGGIFGTAIAAELGQFCSVTLFEKNAELMQEGSFVNQYRHHKGYHYPRSDETVREIQETTAEFEEVFRGAIISGWRTYYGLAREGSLVSIEEFLAFCKRNGLPYRKSFPAKDLLERSALSLSVEVPEPNYDHAELKRIAERRLAALPGVRVMTGTSVIGCVLGQDGEKTIVFTRNGKKQRRQFDYVINATYAHMNQFARWLRYEPRPVRVDFAEVLIVRLPIAPVSLTVIDGPFATLMPTGRPDEFTLYHVRESILDRYVPSDGVVHRPERVRSNREAILRESLKLFPILKDAEIVESRFVHRGVRAYREHDDSRVADLVDHGFGTWSVLSGKILSSVSMGKSIAAIIRKATEDTALHGALFDKHPIQLSARARK